MSTSYAYVDIVIEVVAVHGRIRKDILHKWVNTGDKIRQGIINTGGKVKEGGPMLQRWF
jgi:hypothetical protein